MIQTCQSHCTLFGIAYATSLVTSDVISFVNACVSLLFSFLMLWVIDLWMIGVTRLRLEAYFQPCRKYKFNILFKMAIYFDAMVTEVFNISSYKVAKFFP